MLLNETLTIVLLTSLTTPATAAIYYASPKGDGDGRSQASCFRIADFWSVAQPGDTLLLLDGKYTGANSMVNPPQDLMGKPGTPITIKALNDGRVLLDGQGQYAQVRLFHNDHFTIEGINACNSSGTVVGFSRSNHNIARRICAWDAGDGNHAVFGIHYGEHNLLEDCAGWGIARKIYSPSQRGNYTTYRRCWGRWEGCHVVGPKVTFEFVYNCHSTVFENCLGTWDARKMKETYVLMDYYGKPWTKQGSKPPQTFTNYGVDQPYGILSADAGVQEGFTKGASLYGCIAYLPAGSRLIHFGSLFFTHRRAGETYVENCILYVDPTMPQPPKCATFIGCRGGNVTCIGGSESTHGTGSEIENVLESIDGRDIVAQHGNILTTEKGATIMYRYEDGVLTDKPLWPWPMNQRIIDAMKLAGYETPVDVTKTIFELAGGTPEFE